MDLNINPEPGFQTRYLQCSMMFLCNTVMFTMRSSLGVAILAMTDKSKADENVEIYEWSEKIRGVILSSFFWGYTIMQLPIGIISKKYGGKLPLLSGLIVNGILCLLTPTLTKLGGWVAMCIIRGCMGFTQSCFKPSNHTLLGKWVPPNERNRIATFVYSSMPIGVVLAMPLTGLLSSTYLGWHLIFYVMGSLSLVTAVIYWIFTASSPAEHKFIKDNEILYIESVVGTSNKEEIPIPWKHIWTSIPLYAVMAAHIGKTWCAVLLVSELPAYLKEGLNMSIEKGSTFSALPFIAEFLVSIVACYIADLIVNKRIISISASRKLFQSISSFGLTIGFIILTFLDTNHKTLIIVVVTITTSLMGCSNCGYMMTHIDMSPNFGGVLYSITNCACNLCSILTPISAGYILGDQPTDLSRWNIIFYVAGAISAFTNIIFIMFGSSERQPWDNLRKYSRYSLVPARITKEFLLKEKEYLFKSNDGNSEENNVKKTNT